MEKTPKHAEEHWEANKLLEHLLAVTGLLPDTNYIVIDTHTHNNF